MKLMPIWIFQFNFQVSAITFPHFNRFHTCFGWFNFWDWYYGTDAELERTPVIKERHVVLKDLRSARELVPDGKYD